MKRKMSFIAIIIFWTLYWWQARETHIARPAQDHRTQNLDGLNAPTSNTKADIKINLPKSVQRQPSSSETEHHIQNYLKQYFALTPSDQRSMYSMRLINKTSTREYYQVLLKNLPIESLIVQGKFVDSNEIQPFPMFEILDDQNLIGTEEAQSRIRTSNGNVESFGKVEQVWELKANQQLSPAYKISVQIKDVYGPETWIINAKSGEISSINTHSRR